MSSMPMARRALSRIDLRHTVYVAMPVVPREGEDQAVNVDPRLMVPVTASAIRLVVPILEDRLEAIALAIESRKKERAALFRAIEEIKSKCSTW